MHIVFDKGTMFPTCVKYIFTIWQKLRHGYDSVVSLLTFFSYLNILENKEEIQGLLTLLMDAVMSEK